MKKLLKFSTITFLLAIAVSPSVLIGCSEQAQPNKVELKTECLKGVLYYKEGWWLAPVLTQENKVVTCNE